MNTSTVGTCTVRVDVNDGRGGTANTQITITTVAAIACNIAAVSNVANVNFTRNRQNKTINVTVTNAAGSTGAATITSLAAVAGANFSVSSVSLTRRTRGPVLPLTLAPGTQQVFKIKLRSTARGNALAPFVRVAGTCAGVAFNVPASSDLFIIPAVRWNLEKGLANGNAVTTQFQLFDLNGRLVLNQTDVTETALSAVDRNGRPLASGVYFAVVTVSNSHGTILRRVVQKFVIQR